MRLYRQTDGRTDTLWWQYHVLQYMYRAVKFGLWRTSTEAKIAALALSHFCSPGGSAILGAEV